MGEPVLTSISPADAELALRARSENLTANQTAAAAGSSSSSGSTSSESPSLPPAKPTPEEEKTKKARREIGTLILGINAAVIRTNKRKPNLPRTEPISEEESDELVDTLAPLVVKYDVTIPGLDEIVGGLTFLAIVVPRLAGVGYHLVAKNPDRPPEPKPAVPGAPPAPATRAAA